MKKSLILTVLFSLTLFPGFGQQGDSLIQVTEKLYMISGLGGNATFLVTQEGVLLVDAGTVKKDGRAIEKHIRSVTDRPVKYLVYTHYHYDHANGACGLSDDPVIISHRYQAQNLKAFGKGFLSMYRDENLQPRAKNLKEKADSLKKIGDPGWEEVREKYDKVSELLADVEETSIVFPDIRFSQNMELTLGSDTVNLIYAGATHTKGNILVEFRNQNTLVTGDFFFNHCMPYIDYKAGSDTRNWVAQLKKFAGKKYRHVIPGHGNLAETKDLEKQLNYLTDLREAVKKGITENKSVESLKGEIKMQEYHDYGFQHMLPGEIEAVYKELKRK